MTTKATTLGASRAGLSSVIVTDAPAGTWLISNIGVETVLLSGVSGAAAMNGQAQVLFTSVPVSAGAATMNGAASMAARAPVSGSAEMDGAASMTAVGGSNHPPVYVIGMLQNIISSQVVVLAVAPILHDTVNVTDRAMGGLRYHPVLTSGVRVQSSPIPAWHAVLGLVQSLTIHPAASQMFTWGRTLTQAFKVSAAAAVHGIYKNTLAQLFRLNDVDGFSHTIPLTLSQNLTLHLSLASISNLKLLQNFLMASTGVPKATYHFVLAGQVVIKSIIDLFARKVLTQLFTVHPTLNRQYIANNSLAQLLTVHPALTNKLVLEIAEVGNLQLSPSQLVHMIYKGDPLLDGVVITALYISPSGTTTTWAVNTRTNAVTEYTNYDFRSFAWMGNRYIAAGAAGLYELDGDTDDGTLIISEMMSGYLQLNEKKLFGIKGAYIAIRGGGRFYLKLISGDGREYVYELRAQPNLMTTKIKVGKGIRTTYMAFSLITEGQDFDLDSIEFIPMTSGRRV